MPANLQHDVLEALEEARNYNAWVASLVLPHLGDDPIDVGSGTGTYAALWLEAGVSRLTVSDMDPEMVASLADRFAREPGVVVKRLDLPGASPGEHSAVVGLNVLEHISDDIRALRGARRLVRRGGVVAMFVPAFPFAMSRFDRAIGHHRRYTTATLQAAFSGAGLELEEIRYVNAPGLVAWTIGMRLLGLSPREGPLLRTWDRTIVPIARTLETRWAPPFGQSLFAVGRNGS